MDISAANPMRSGELTFEPTRLFSPAYFRYRVQESHKFGPMSICEDGPLRLAFALKLTACHRDRHQNCELLEIKDPEGYGGEGGIRTHGRG
jgi:hypothetical protein